LVLFGLSIALGSQQSKDIWEIADIETKRFPPEIFSKLPSNIVIKLQAENYTIHQTYANLTPHNVIHGEFLKKGQIDWAILCSKNRISSIIIFWGGSEKNYSKISERPDREYLQNIGNGKIGYSRIISVAEKNFILDHYKAYGGLIPPNIEHEGIDDGFVGKGSIVHYYYKGKWLQLKGAD